MNTNNSSADKSKQNMKMVLIIWMVIGAAFFIYGLVSGNSSIVTGGLITVIIGFFMFLPGLMAKK